MNGKTVNDVNEMDFDDFENDVKKMDFDSVRVDTEKEQLESLLESIDMKCFDREIENLRDDIFRKLVAKRSLGYIGKNMVMEDVKTYLSVKLIHDLQVADSYSNPKDSYTSEMLSAAFPSRHANRLLRKVFADEILDQVAESAS